jgi:multidrug efflux pump subunit AcrB
MQDLTVESGVSKTQYQYSLKDQDFTELNAWMLKLIDDLSRLPELSDVSSDQQDKARRSL